MATETENCAPRARVLAALSHRQPERVPFSWGFGPTAEMQVILREQLARQGFGQLP